MSCDYCEELSLKYDLRKCGCLPVEFLCGACGEVKDFYSQAVMATCTPEMAEFWVCGVPSVFLGFCEDCALSGDQ
jgi:hypothetical protein